MSLPAYLKYIGLTVLFTVAAINFTKTTLNVIQSSKRLDVIKSEVGSLEVQKEALLKDLDYKKTDSYVEEEARNKLGMVKPGEYLFVTPSVLSAQTHNEENQADTTETSSNFKLWLQLFF